MGCGAAEEPPSVGAPDTNVAPASACAEGFGELPGGAGCTPVLPKDACAAGTFAQIGSTECVPVGVTECAAGFAKDPSGWGCTPILAEVACTSGRERLGSTKCEPVSDCGGAFPPSSSGALLFVSAALSDAQVDATHFKDLAEAVAAAPANAVIAVDEGTYVTKASLKLKAKGVSVVGRCTDKVIVKQTDGVIGSGVEIGLVDGITIKNLTFRGFNGAVSVLGGKAKLDSLVIEDGLLGGVIVANSGADVSLSNVVVRGTKVRADNDQAFGVFVSNGANVTIQDSVFAGNEFVNVGAAKPGTKVTLSRSIVRDGKPFGDVPGFGMGVYVAEGANITIDESAITDNSTSAVDVFTQAGPKTSATIRRSVVRGTKYDRVNKIARGVEATGSNVVLEQTTIAGNAQVEMLLSTGTKATITNTTLRGNPQPNDADRGALGFSNDGTTTTAKSLAIILPRAGMEIQGTSKVDLDSSLILSTRAAPTVYENDHWVGVGISVERKATLKMTASTVQDARMAGILATGNVSLEGTLIRGTRPSLDGFAGRGFSIQNGGVSELVRSAIVDNAEVGVMLMMDAASLSMLDSTIQDTSFDAAGEYGIGLGIGGEAVATIEGTTITGSKGVGILCSEAGANVRRATISNNTVGVHAQDGSSLSEGDGDIDPRILKISTDTRFINNATKAGNALVAIPDVLTPKSAKPR